MDISGWGWVDPRHFGLWNPEHFYDGTLHTEYIYETKRIGEMIEKRNQITQHISRKLLTKPTKGSGGIWLYHCF